MANAFSKGRPIEPLAVTAEERGYLERQVRRHRVSRSLSERCRIILRCADGLQSKMVAAELGVHEHTVGKWRRRFLADRIDGLFDEARPGRPRMIHDDAAAKLLYLILNRSEKEWVMPAREWAMAKAQFAVLFGDRFVRAMAA